MIQREEFWYSMDSLCRGRIIFTVSRDRMAVDRRFFTSFTPESQHPMRSGGSSAYQSLRTPLRAGSHCLKHGEDSEMRSWMRSPESAAVSLYTLLDSLAVTSLSRVRRLWLSRHLIFEYGL